MEVGGGAVMVVVVVVGREGGNPVTIPCRLVLQSSEGHSSRTSSDKPSLTVTQCD